MMTAISNEKQRQKQKLVSFKDLPKDYINAVVAIEDRQFFEHSGINFRGIMRARLARRERRPDAGRRLVDHSAAGQELLPHA